MCTVGDLVDTYGTSEHHTPWDMAPHHNGKFLNGPGDSGKNNMLLVINVIPGLIGNI